MGEQAASCSEASNTLKRCLRDSKCGRTTNKSLKECLKESHECQPYFYAYMRCKQSKFDNRSRIAGPKAT
eukprot:maker-scaffold_4-snap-gene-10.54-mRNA-1 protein AED:0.38 eAED:0.38 QI:110/1/1/1/0/0/3/411/69